MKQMLLKIFKHQLLLMPDSIGPLIGAMRAIGVRHKIKLLVVLDELID